MKFECSKACKGSRILTPVPKKQIAGPGLLDSVKEVTSQCGTCLNNNTNPTVRLEYAVISRGISPGALWQIEFSEIPRKGRFWIFAGTYSYFLWVARSIPL